MGISIPIGSGADVGAAAPAPTGVSIPLGIGGGVAAVTGTDRETRVLRALAAAAALQSSGEALALAKNIKDDASHIAKLTVDPTKIAPVLAAMDRSFTEGTGGVTPNAIQQAAARTVRADPKLVAVAQAALKSLAPDVTTNALNWVATIDSALLAPAANASFRRNGLEQVPKATQLGRLAQLEARIAKLEGTAPGAVASITVTFPTAAILVGSTARAGKTIADASGKVVVAAVSWSSTKPNFATVTQDGDVTAIAAGAADIVASAAGVAGEVPVNVVDTFAVALGSASVAAGGTTTAAITAAGGGSITAPPPTWSSSNPAVATVSSNGLVTAVVAGSANIVATIGATSVTSALTVT